MYPLNLAQHAVMYRPAHHVPGQVVPMAVKVCACVVPVLTLLGASVIRGAYYFRGKWEEKEIDRLLANRQCAWYYTDYRLQFCPMPSLDLPTINERDWFTLEQEYEFGKAERARERQEREERYAREEAEREERYAREEAERKERERIRDEERAKEQEEIRLLEEEIARKQEERQKEKEQWRKEEEEREEQKRIDEEEQLVRWQLLEIDHENWVKENEEERQRKLAEEVKRQAKIMCELYSYCPDQPKPPPTDCARIKPHIYSTLSAMDRALREELRPDCPNHAKVLLSQNFNEQQYKASGCRYVKKEKNAALKAVHPDTQSTENGKERGNIAAQRVVRAAETLCS